MNGSDDFDPLEQSSVDQNQSFPGSHTVPTPASDLLLEEVERLKLRSEAFRSIADRFYMLWWNLPGMTTRQVDQDIQDMYRMFMDLAPAMGVSRNGIPELRECCGRKRSWKDDRLSGKSDPLLVMPIVRDEEPELGWCPGDIVRRITRFFGVRYCEKCDKRRRVINAFFKCGGP